MLLALYLPPAVVTQNAVNLFSKKEQTGKSGTGRDIHSHIFEIIAKKR